MSSARRCRPSSWSRANWSARSSRARATPRTSACCASRPSAARSSSSKLTELPAPGEPFERMKLSALIEEVIAPHRDIGVQIEVEIPKDDPGEPVGARNPAILYGLGNILENAVDFARHQVQVAASWDDDKVSVVVADDGSGFPPEDHRPHGGALCYQRAGPADARPRNARARPRLLHRQDPAGALRRQNIVGKPGLPAARCDREDTLEAGRVRTPERPGRSISTPSRKTIAAEKVAAPPLAENR